MALTPEEQAKLNKKMQELAIAQVADRARHVEKRGLNKPGDENWQGFVAKQLAWLDKYYDKEKRMYKTQLHRALLDLRKGKKSPNIDLD